MSTAIISMPVASPGTRTADAGSELGPLQVVMVFLTAAIMAGGALLLSAAESTTLVDGAVAWQANSPLRAVVQLLCLNYEFPTTYAGEIKNYLLALGAGLGVLALTVAVLSRSKAEPDAGSPAGPGQRGAWSAAVAAQMLVVFLLLWSFASSRWSSAPVLSVGASILATLQLLWAFSLAHGLTARGARICAASMLTVLAVTSALAIWYYYARNPVLPAKFPLGNPSFLAASLLPGILLSVTAIVQALDRRSQLSDGRRVLIVLLSLAALSLCLWALILARSRGPIVGLVGGLLAVWFFIGSGRWKILPVLVGLTAAVGIGWFFVQSMELPSPTGRSATMRFRLHAWSYAWRMFRNRPIAGYGQGGFTLHGDSYAADDILNDPLAFVARVEHAHNEWLETLCDLGAVGLLLSAGVIVATLIAGGRAIHRNNAAGRPWILIGLLGAYVALLVEEFFGVGLRTSGVPTFFFTLLGLIWASCRGYPSPLLLYASSTPNRRIAAGVVGGSVALAAIGIAQQDFQAARDAYRVTEAFEKGDDEQAIRYAASGVFRLNPQRVLENLYRMVEANLRAADRFVQRAVDRRRRSLESDPPDARLQLFAAEDLQSADEYLKAASGGLKQLVSASPGFINNGVLEARAGILQAQIAQDRGDLASRDAFLRNAAAALQREMRRQPYNASLAMEYVRLAGAELETPAILDTLARPLRQNRIQEGHVALLSELAKDPAFADRLNAAASEALEQIAAAPPSRAEHGRWAPEKLRLAAAAAFFAGDFSRAHDLLLAACRAYDPIAASAPIGSASCYAELADARFFADPLQAAEAIAYGQRAIELVPSSEAGRALQASVHQRMIQYQLAASNEGEAIRLLRLTAPAGATDEMVRRELGLRLRRLCESIIVQKRAWLQSEAGQSTLEKVESWVTRAAELSPPDAGAHYLAADLGVLRRRPETAAAELAAALKTGLNPQAALGLLDLARAEGVSDPSLDGIREDLERRLGLEQSSAEQAQDPTPP